MNTYGFNRTTACGRRNFPDPTRECAGGVAPGFPEAAEAAIPSTVTGTPSTLTSRRFPMQRLYFALFLALALLLASIPVRAGETTPLVADPVGSFLGVSGILFALSLLARSGLDAVRERTRPRERRP